MQILRSQQAFRRSNLLDVVADMAWQIEEAEILLRFTRIPCFIDQLAFLSCQKIIVPKPIGQHDLWFWLSTSIENADQRLSRTFLKNPKHLKLKKLVNIFRCFCSAICGRMPRFTNFTLISISPPLRSRWPSSSADIVVRASY